MDSDPDRRQASAGALVRDLEAAVADGSKGAVAQLHQPTAPMRAPAHDGPPLPPRVFGAPPSQRRRRLLQVLACVATLGLLAAGAWLLVAGTGGGTDNGTGSSGQAANQRRGAAAQGSSEAATSAAATTPSPEATTTAPSSTTTTAPPGSAIPSSDTAAGAGTGAQLNDQGYGLIQQGRYAAAVPVLRRAVRAFPRGTSDIDYAYALFNLGHALRMAGHPDEAIPILEQRLRIPDQTQTVQAELAAARAEAGQ
jgi:serine/threonine-protein kinase